MLDERGHRLHRGAWACYLAEYGDRCVEADAISANEIHERVETAILSHIDQQAWDRTVAAQEQEQTEVNRKL